MGWLDKITDALFDRRVTKPISYGGGLTRLPDENPASGMTYDHDGWVTFEAWAASRWENYEVGRLHCQLTPNTGQVCPYCYAVYLEEQSAFMAANHDDSGARKRWAVGVQEQRRMREALVACRCETQLRAADAAEIVEHLNRQYFPRRAESL